MKALSVSSGQLTGPWLLVGRGLWLVVAFLTVGLFIIAVPPRFEQLQAVCAGAPCQQPSLSMEDIRLLQGLGLSRSAHAVYSLALELVFAGLNFLIAAIIFARRSFDRIALLVALLLMTFGPATFTGTLNALAAQSSGWQLPMGIVSSLPGTLPDWLLQPLSPWRLPVGFVASVGQVCFALFFFLFPDGRFLPRWGIVPVALWIGGQVPAAFFPASFFNPANWPQSLAIAVWVSYLACFAYAQVYRYRRVSDTVERQQTKWVVFGITAAVAGFFLVALLAFILAALGLSGVLFRQVVLTAIYLAMLLLPLSFAFAILRSRLWDIDLIINRSLVYVPLTAILAGLFAALITFSQKLAVVITGQEADAATVLTTLFVVAAFTPVKDRLQALVDKRFKEASEAGKRLNAFADKVHFRLSAVDPQQLNRRFLDEAVAAFQAKGGAVHLEGRGTWSPISTVGEWNGEAKLSVPVETGAMSFGLISLNARSDGREYSAHDRELLQHAASVVALAIQQDQTAESFSPI
jgi:hypothetical protein